METNEIDLSTETPPDTTPARRRNSPKNKLTLNDVVAIRTDRTAGAKIYALAIQYKVSTATISKVCSGKLYGGV